MIKQFAFYKVIDMKSANTPDNRINGDDVHGNDDGKSGFRENSQLTYNNTAAVK